MTAQPPDKPAILIVDDVPANTHMLMQTLGDAYRFIPAKDGKNALHKAEKASRLDLVLLDIMMPEMDGYEVLRRLKQHPRLMNVPVIFITAVTDGSDEAKGFHLGAVDYITKPFVAEVVRARVATHVELKQKTDLLEKLAATDGLTGIYNRRKIDQLQDYEFRRAMRSRRPLALAIIDIDHFKRYNDFYGHAQGDRCLKSVTTALKGALKRSGDALGRYGGEEFLVLLPDLDEDGTRHMALEFVDAVAALGIPHQDSPTAPRVTVSVGVAVSRPGKEGPRQDGLLAAADKMLYAAKEGGRNQMRAAILGADGVLLEC